MIRARNPRATRRFFFSILRLNASDNVVVVHYARVYEFGAGSPVRKALPAASRRCNPVARLTHDNRDKSEAAATTFDDVSVRFEKRIHGVVIIE